VGDGEGKGNAKAKATADPLRDDNQKGKSKCKGNSSDKSDFDEG
jgi:hypothetical protein